MTVEIEFQRTRLDDCMDEIKAILEANGVTLEMAMAKLLEPKAQDSMTPEAEADKIDLFISADRLPYKLGKMRVEELMRQAFTLGAVLLLPLALTPASVAAPQGTGAVTLISTGDRLTPGYRVTVQPDGALASALVPYGHQKPLRRTDRMIAVNRQRFFADLAAAEPLSALPTGTPASAAPGRHGRRSRQAAPVPGVTPFPQVFVRYRGRLSPNLRAASSTPGKALYQDVKQILQVLRLPIPDQP